MNYQRDMNEYLHFCQYQKKLDEKTIKAYRIDLNQFLIFLEKHDGKADKETLNSYIIHLHNKYKQKSVKRKIASAKAFFSYLESEERMEYNPFHVVKARFKEEIVLPKTIPIDVIEKLLEYLYGEWRAEDLSGKRKNLLLRDIAVVELMFATGLRISELCGLRDECVDLKQGVLRILGKGAKERCLYICNENVLGALRGYREAFKAEIEGSGYFFVNRYGERLSEQSARRRIQKHVKGAAIDLHITPHMFRHAFATLLLEEDVDIRYIQKMLGHSSIVTTQIYTFVTTKKQQEILREKHPRNRMKV